MASMTPPTVRDFISHTLRNVAVEDIPARLTGLAVRRGPIGRDEVIVSATTTGTNPRRWWLSVASAKAPDGPTLLVRASRATLLPPTILPAPAK